MKNTLIFSQENLNNAEDPPFDIAHFSSFEEEGFLQRENTNFKNPPGSPFEKTQAQCEGKEFYLGNLPRIRFCRLLSKPIRAGDGALLPLKGVTFSLASGKIRHLIVRLGGGDGDASEIYLPFETARLSSWRITPESLRPRSPKNTQRLLLQKPVYSTGGTYLGKLTDALIKNGELRLLYADGKPFCADRIYADGDALLLRPAEAYPLGQPFPPNLRNEKSGDMPVRFSAQINRAVLQYFIREGKLIALTTSLPLFSSFSAADKTNEKSSGTPQR